MHFVARLSSGLCVVYARTAGLVRVESATARQVLMPVDFTLAIL